MLALVTCGTWSAGKTTVAQLAAQGPPWRQPVEGAPAARHHRLHQNALALLQDRLRPVLATRQARTPGCDDGLLSAFGQVSSTDSPGFERPDARHETCPGAGGSAATAGATIPAVWDSHSRLVDHVALTPGHIPDQR